MIKNYLLIMFTLILFTSCNEYQKLLRNEDVKVKYQMAEKYFENEEFIRWLSNFN